MRDKKNLSKKKKIKKNNTFFILKSLKKNIKSWIALFIALYSLCGTTHFLKGFITFLIILFIVYWVHLRSHDYKHILSIGHFYHHENDNYFSHLIQINIELLLGLVLYYFNIYLLNNLLDNWIIAFVYLFYTSVHNINYSLLKVNKTHYLHHINSKTNIGPDICDIIFKTKNKNINKKEYIEDTDHYINNIFIILFILLCTRKICENEKIINLIDRILFVTIILSIIFFCISNIFLTIFHY